jgi:hypothetical protein
MFRLSLLMSWTLITGALAFAAWTDRHTPQLLTTWIGLWVFAVVGPTMQALLIHRRLGEVLHSCPMTPPRVHRDLAHARFVIVMCATMTVLLAWALRSML